MLAQKRNKIMYKNIFSNFFLFPIGHLTHPPTSKVFLDFLNFFLFTWPLSGFVKKTIQKIRDYYGSGWVGPGLTRNIFFWKIFKNSPKPVLIFWSRGGLVGPYTMCIMSVYRLLEVAGYYDLSVVSMSVMGLKKIGFWGELYPIFFGFLELF